MSRMNLSRRLPRQVTIGALAAVALATSACGAVAERVAEEGLERAAENETGGEVDLDFNADGGFSIETEDGSMSVGEDGSFVIEGADGEVITGQADSEDGSFVVEGEDGTSSLRTITEIPQEWPASVPQPSGLSDINGTIAIENDDVFITLSASTSSGAEFAAAYSAQLEGAGFERTSYFESDGTVQASYLGGTHSVSVTTSGPDAGAVAVGVFSN